MTAAGFYISLIVLILAVSAAALALASYGAFRHRAALWLSICMAGLVCFSAAILVFGIADAAGAGIVGPVGVRLLFQAFGSVLLAHALPRFLLSAFGVRRRLALRLLDAATCAVAALSAVRVAGGWRDMAAAPAVPDAVLRILLFVLVGGAMIVTLVFQQRLPDRSLYRSVAAQVGALAVVLPFVYLEDFGLFSVPGLRNLGGLVLIAAASAAGILHARRSLMRPRYAEGDAPSAYFLERFGVSGRERDVAAGVLQGLSNAQIADRLFISSRTVEKHLSTIYRKAGIKSRLQLYTLLRSDSE